MNHEHIYSMIQVIFISTTLMSHLKENSYLNANPIISFAHDFLTRIKSAVGECLTGPPAYSSLSLFAALTSVYSDLVHRNTYNDLNSHFFSSGGLFLHLNILE